MTDSYSDKLLRSAHTFLSRWNGVNAQMLELTISIKHLTILLEEPSREGNLLIACIDPQWISGPLRWTNSNIEVVAHQNLDDDPCFRVVDVGSGLEVVCGSVELKENVKRQRYPA